MYSLGYCKKCREFSMDRELRCICGKFEHFETEQERKDFLAELVSSAAARKSMSNDELIIKNVAWEIHQDVFPNYSREQFENDWPNIFKEVPLSLKIDLLEAYREAQTEKE